MSIAPWTFRADRLRRIRTLRLASCLAALLVVNQLSAVYARLGRQAESAAARQKFEQALALPAGGAAH